MKVHQNIIVNNNNNNNQIMKVVHELIISR